MSHEEERIYKIQGPDGRFSEGGMGAEWTKHGKYWTRLGFVKSHLQLFISGYNPKGSPYKPEDMVVEYGLVELRRFPVSELFEEPRTRKNVHVDIGEGSQFRKISKEEIAQGIIDGTLIKS